MNGSAARAGVAVQLGGPGTVLAPGEIQAFVRDRLGAEPLDGRSVCVLVPDGTRSCPLPLLIEAVHQALHGRVSRLTVLVALGTHAPMSQRALAAHLGADQGAGYPGMAVLNHAWWDDATFADASAPAGSPSCPAGCSAAACRCASTGP